jgi:hypothetical protein
LQGQGTQFDLGLHIEKLPYGATWSFCRPQRRFACSWGANFAEKGTGDLPKEASRTCMLIQADLSHFS